MRRSRDSMVSLLVLAIPTFAAFVYLFPGYFQADHQTTIAKIATGIPSQWHSLTWGYLAYPFIYLSPHYAVYGVVQLVMFVLCAYCAACRLKRLGVIRWTTPLCLFFGLFPTYLLYNQLWGTDLCFAYVMLWMTSLLVELCVRGEDALRDASFCIRLALSILVITLLRKNAILISVFLCLILPLVYKPVRRRAIVVCVLPTVVAMLADSLFFPRVLGATPSASQELLSVPSAQIARVYAEGGEVPSDVDAVLTRDRTSEEWADAYLPYCADYAKKGRELTADFVVAWAKLGLRNPGIYLDAYKEMLYPYWTFGEAKGYAYGIGLSTDFGLHEDFTLSFADGLREGYVREFDGKAAKSHQFLWPRRLEKWVDKRLSAPLRWAFYAILFNRGLPLYALLAGGLLAVAKRKGRDYLIVAMPSTCVMLSLYVFAPVASFRYLLGCYYVLPLVVLVLLYWLARKEPTDQGERRGKHHKSS